jgi:hypothetical protein
MGSRTEQITIYVTEERKTELEQRANDEDDSLSGVINGMIDTQLQQDAQDAIASETRAEDRLQELINVGTEEMANIAREIRDMNAKYGAYAIANFELMKHDHTDHVRKQALSTGARRIRQDLDVVTQELAADVETGDDPTDAPTASDTPSGDTPETASADDGTASSEPATDTDGSVTEQTESMSAADAMTGGDSTATTSDDEADDSDGEPDLFDQLRRDQDEE